MPALPNPFRRPWMAPSRVLWLCLVCLYCLSLGQGMAQAPGSTDPLAPGKYSIAGIDVEGAEFTAPSSIITLSGLFVGKEIEYPSTDLGDAIQKLWKQNIFTNIQVRLDNVVGNKLFLVISLEERPRMTKFSFNGVSKSQADDIRERIQLVANTILTESKEQNAIRSIQNYFIEKGHLFTEVNVTTEQDPVVKNGVIVRFNVQKGKKVKIQRIFLDGNEELTDRQLRKKMKKTKQMAIWRVFKRSKFIRADFEEDKKALVRFFNAEGFRDAKIQRDSVEKLNAKRVNVYLSVVEGQKYYIREISWVGNQLYTEQELGRVLGIKRGAVYNRDLLERRLYMDPSGQDVSSLYLDDGYLFFQVEPVEIRVEGDSVDLEIRISEGEQATYRRIIIEGNTRTSDHVILREIRTLPGNKFSRSELLRTQRELINLGYFDQQEFDMVPIPDPATGTVDIKYVLSEKPSDQLFFQGGWGGRVRDPNTGQILSSGLVLTVGLTFTNFSGRKLFGPRRNWGGPLPSGDGQRLSLSVQLNGLGFQNYGINFMEPWFGGKKPNSLGVGVNYSIFQSTFNNYAVRILNTSLDLGRRLKWPDDYFRMFTSLNYRYYDLNEAQNQFPEYNAQRGFINILSLRQTIERSSMAPMLFPRMGSMISFSVEATPPWSLLSGADYSTMNDAEKFKMLEFHKWKLQTQTFTAITNGKMPLVFATRMNFGFLGFYNRQIGTSPFERFYLGGEGWQMFNLDGREIMSLRGYDQPLIGSRNGNTAFTQYTLQLRQALSLSPAATVWLHAFAEGGNAWGKLEEFDPFTMYRSVGGGIRLFLAMFGLMGVDVAWSLDEHRPEGGGPLNNKNGRRGAPGFHFFIGQEF